MMGDMDQARTAFRQAAAATNDFPGKRRFNAGLSFSNAAKSPATTELSSGDIGNDAEPAARRSRDAHAPRRVLRKAGRFREAAATYEEALRLNPKLLSATAKLAQLNAGPLQASDKALEFARKARELAPNDPKIVGILGSAAYQTGNFTWAYSLLQESARRLPNDAEVLHDFAWAAYSLGKVSEARQAMQRLLAAAPDSSQSKDARLFLDMTAPVQDGTEPVAAEPEIEKVLNEKPNYVPALMAKAEILRQRRDSKRQPLSTPRSCDASRISPRHKRNWLLSTWKFPTSATKPTTSPQRLGELSPTIQNSPRFSPSLATTGRSSLMPCNCCNKARRKSLWMPNISTIWEWPR